METNFSPALLHSALFTCPDDGDWARDRADKISDIGFVLEGGLPVWESKPSELAEL